MDFFCYYKKTICFCIILRTFYPLKCGKYFFLSYFCSVNIYNIDTNGSILIQDNRRIMV